MSAGLTPPARRGPLTVPVPRPDGQVYVSIEVQFPDGRGVVISNREQPDPDWPAHMRFPDVGSPMAVAERLLEATYGEVRAALDDL